MKITNIEIDNFLTIGHIEANLDNKGLVLIQGENDDDTSQSSNGSGKSSFPDAISWCLYGETARGATGDAVVNETTGKQTRVAVTIEDGSQTYAVARHRKHKTGKNRLELHDSTGNDLTKGTDKLTQPLVDRIVGCSAEVFNAAIYSGQEQIPDLPGMTDKFLKQIVEEAAGINEVQLAFETANKRLTQAKYEHTDIQTEMVGLEGRRSAASDTLNNMAVEEINWDVAHAQRVKDQEEIVEGQAAMLVQAEIDADQAQTELTKLESGKAAIQAKIAGVRGELAQLTELERAISKAELVVNSAHSKCSNLKAQLASCERDVKAKEKAVTDSNSLIGSPCGECGKPYAEADVADRVVAMKKALKQAQLEVSATKAEGLAVVEEIEELTKAVRAAEADRDNYKAGMTDTSASVEKIQKVDAAINPRRNTISIYESSKARQATHELNLTRLKAETFPGAKSKQDAKLLLTKVTGAISSTQERLNESKAALAVKQSVASVLSPAGVRAHILDTVTPFLNDRTARYLSALTDGNITAIWSTISLTAKGEARERFAIDVASAVGAKDFKGLSGGEKRKVRLATSMALQDLVASRATKPIDLYIADEIDDALDESGLERLMSILDEKARERGTVLIISHNDLAGWISNSVTIRKKDGLSSMEGSALA